MFKCSYQLKSTYITLHLGNSEVSERSEKGCLNLWVKVEKLCKLSLPNFVIEMV